MTRHSAPASSGQLAASPTKRGADFHVLDGRELTVLLASLRKRFPEAS